MLENPGTLFTKFNELLNSINVLELNQCQPPKRDVSLAELLAFGLLFLGLKLAVFISKAAKVLGSPSEERICG